MAKIGYAMTSSFCTIDTAIKGLQSLIDAGHDVVPIASPSIFNTDTRFGNGEDFKRKIETLTNKKVITTIVEAEPLGPKNPLDLIVVAPATGSFISKLANATTDSPVMMAVKATLRNGKPVVLGISTNDGLGLNGKNIMTLLNTKNIFFIPFGQDDYINKPNSLVAHFDLLIPTVESALQHKQYQPVLKEYENDFVLEKRKK